MTIEAHHITKRFDDFVALDGVSLRVETGELVALLGPSGSGKTTLLRIIAGLEEPDPGSGPILFHDEDVRGIHARNRRVGFVFQHYALFRHMTVFENIAFGLRVKSRRERPSPTEIRDRVESLLALVQLQGLAGRYPNQLSGGQRQRVALARALAVEPKVLLLDEPFGALDAKVRKELREWLRRLHDEIHVTSVFVTHDQDEALEVADRVAVMNAGRIEQIGTPDEVFHNPQTGFVMDFIGEVNRFRGRVLGNRIFIGNAAFRADNIPVGTAGRAEVLVRPHEIDLGTGANGSSVEACVEHVHSAGSSVRLHLRSETGDPIVAEIPQSRFNETEIYPGRTVHLSLRRVRVFAPGGDGEETGSDEEPARLASAV